MRSYRIAYNSIAVTLAILLLLTSCNQTKQVTPVESETGTEIRTFTDSCGRKVEIPKVIKKVAPSGPLAQIVLYTVCPDKLAGLAADFSDKAKEYIDGKYWELPKFGQFYGKNASLNMEALAAEAPDIIVDIGEAKKTVKEDMDALQKQLGIPVLFIEATLPTMEQAYYKLGDLVGEREQAKKLAEYCAKTIKDANKLSKQIPDPDRKTVYYALGDAGLNTNAAGSIHADIIDVVGAVNAADVTLTPSGGGSVVSFEQVMAWNPDIIITSPGGLYNTLQNDELWLTLDAAKNENIFEIPTGPFNFMSDPPSVNRIIGIKWLGNLLYPELFKYDISQEVRTFYKDFYHIDISADQVGNILENSGLQLES